jgi:hypothetical protein
LKKAHGIGAHLFVLLLSGTACLVVKIDLPAAAAARPTATCPPPMTTTPSPPAPNLLSPTNGSVGVPPIQTRLRQSFFLGKTLPILLISESGVVTRLQPENTPTAEEREVTFKPIPLSPSTIYSVFQEYTDYDGENPPVCAALQLDRIGTFKTSAQ